MNTIFKHNANAKYSTEYLKGGYNNINFSLLHVYLDEKGRSVKIQLLNIFKDYRIVAKPSTTAVGHDEWPLSKALWMKFLSYVSMSVKFCSVLLYKCTWHIMATP